MGFRSFKNIESSELKATVPTGLSVIRGIGGPVMGVLMAVKGIDPTAAFWWTGGLAATDDEGDVIKLFSFFPRLQQKFRVIATKFGADVDPVADKIFTAGILAGELYNGTVPDWQGAGILLTEAAISTVAITKKRRGGEPRVSVPGKAGLLARFATVGADMAIPAFASSSHMAQEVLSNSANGLAVASIALGAMSCVLLSRTPTNTTPNQPTLGPGPETDNTF